MAASRNAAPRKKPAKADKPKRQKHTKPGGLSMLLRNHQQVAVDSLDRLFSAAAASALTWAMIAIAIALPLFLFLVLQNLQQFGSNIDEATQVSLYMELDTSEAELLTVQNALNSHPTISSTEVISQSQALEEFQALSGFGDVLSGLNENPLPAVIVITPNTEILDQVRSLVEELATIDKVDSVQYDLDWLQRLYEILNLAQRLTLMLGGLLAFGVALVVGNTVRLAIENRRDEIVVVKLVGGTNAYVARPFLYTGLWYGVGGGLLATVLVLLAQLVMQGPVSQLAGLYNGEFVLIKLSLSNIFNVLFLSGFLGWFGAWLSVLRHLKAIEPR
ncbi:ABC transporter permease [Gammaproteobacteria bacterium AH-315-E17]|nr:ABC transporter permease [Gammaproteobacteria bacterium AH-315-E17]